MPPLKFRDWCPFERLDILSKPQHAEKSTSWSEKKKKRLDVDVDEQNGVIL